LPYDWDTSSRGSIVARWRHQPPAYSPVSLASLWSGVRAVFSQDAQRDVLATLNAKYSSERTVLTDTGTSALQLAIQAALEARPGRVALPAYSCYDVSTAAEGADATVLLYDLDPTSLSPDSTSLERAIQNGATAVVVVHLYGVPVDARLLDPLREREDVVLIEDAAQGVGSTLAGTSVGSFGDLSVLSFARGKGMTGGGGGALLARGGLGTGALDGFAPAGRGAAGLPPLLRAFAVWLLARPTLYGLVASLPFLRLGETIYREPSPSSGIARATLGILRKTLALSELEADVRKKNASELIEHIRKRPGKLTPVQPPIGSDPGYLRLPVVLSGGITDAERSTAWRLGVARGYPTPLSRLESCRRICENVDEGFPGAERLAARLLTLPTHSRLRPEDREALRVWTSEEV